MRSRSAVRGYALGRRARRRRARRASSRSTARIRPASRRRRRIGSSSARSTSRSAPRAELRELLRAWTDGRRDDDRRRAASARRTSRARRRPSTPARPSACPLRGSRSPSASGPASSTHRFGLAARAARSAARRSARSPATSSTRPARGGDLCVQACADDPLVAFHAVRNLARIARGAARCAGLQLGFGRTSSTTSAQVTPRNLQGFKDGTNNLDGDDEALDRFVWVGADEPQRWLRGGTYLVARRIRMLIETWDRTSLGEQEADDRPLQGERRAAHGRRTSTTRSTSTARNAGRHAGDPPRRPHPARRPRRERRRADPAPRLLLHRRDRPA